MGDWPKLETGLELEDDIVVSGEFGGPSSHAPVRPWDRPAAPNAAQPERGPEIEVGAGISFDPVSHRRVVVAEMNRALDQAARGMEQAAACAESIGYPPDVLRILGQVSEGLHRAQNLISVLEEPR